MKSADQYDDEGEMFENPYDAGPAPTRAKKKGKKKKAKAKASKKGKRAAASTDPKSMATSIRKIEGKVAGLEKFRVAQQTFNEIAKPVITAGYQAFALPMPSRGVMRGVLAAGSARKAAAR